MSHYPGAAWRPVAYKGLHARIPAKAMILHTNGGGAQLYGWWQQKAADGSHIGAHYQVFRDGRSECYVDPTLVVYHAYGASEWAIGVETEDDGNPDTPWTDAQISTIAAIGRFHGVPPRMLTSPNQGDGVGYHQQYPAWDQSSHDCPGPTRVNQIPAVLHALANSEEPVTPDEIKAIAAEVVKELTPTLLREAQYLAGKENSVFNAKTVGVPAPKEGTP